MLKELVKHFYIGMPCQHVNYMSHPEGKWFKSENERSQLQFLDVWNVLGFSCHPQTILNYEKTLAEVNKSEVQKQVKEVIKVRLLT